MMLNILGLTLGIVGIVVSLVGKNYDAALWATSTCVWIMAKIEGERGRA